MVTGTECTTAYHRSMSRDAATPETPYYVARCSHLGGRGVVEIRSILPESCVYVDFVQWEPDVVCEVNSLCDSQDSAETVWASLNERLIRGDVPNPEASF